jgi:membrane protein YqaA with SNARE-associated domain
VLVPWPVLLLFAFYALRLLTFPSEVVLMPVLMPVPVPAPV